MPSKEYRTFLDSVKGNLVDEGDSTKVARAKLEAMHVAATSTRVSSVGLCTQLLCIKGPLGS